MDALPATPIAEARRKLVDQLPKLVDEYIDTARAEGDTRAYDRLMGFALKAVEGLQVQDKKDPYANLPVIHMHFDGMQLSVDKVEPAKPEVIDVEVKSPFKDSAAQAWAEPPKQLPDDPTDLLPHSPEELAVLEALAQSADAMALPD